VLQALEHATDALFGLLVALGVEGIVTRFV
jgi:hypothetical protein